MTEPSRQAAARQTKSRAKVVSAGQLPVSEFAFDRAGAASPFGDDLIFPVDPALLTYHHLTGDEVAHKD